MPDSSNIDAAISAALLADSALMAIATDGVFFNEAAPNAKKFVIIDLVTSFDHPVENARSHEEATYRVKYVELGLNGLNAKSAAARIDAVLDGKPLTITGYTHMKTERIERIRVTEIDQVDPSLRWQHRGGLYLVMASL